MNKREDHFAAYDQSISELGRRLDALRVLAYRLRSDHRGELERRLDAARGLHLKVAARLEDLRRADEDRWLPARDHADETLARLTRDLTALEADATGMAA
jgi:hypothetical protein